MGCQIPRTSISAPTTRPLAHLHTRCRQIRKASRRAIVSGYNDEVSPFARWEDTFVHAGCRSQRPSKSMQPTQQARAVRQELEMSTKAKRIVPLTKTGPSLTSTIPSLANQHGPIESFGFKGAKSDDVEGFLVKPPNFDASKKYPVKFLIHGGPQGAWGDDWSYRWNPELFASPTSAQPSGYVVIMINFHGSTGYGQKFIDAINGDWGGAPYEDLMKGLDYAETDLSVHRQEPRVRARRQLRRIRHQLDPRPHQSFQMPGVARRHVQRGVRLGDDRRTLVQ